MTQEQKKGVLKLSLILIVFSLLLHFKNNLPNYPSKFVLSQEIQCELDAQQLAYEARLNSNIHKYYVNSINDYSGYQLGLTTEQIDLLINYRKEKKIVRSMFELRKVIALDTAQEMYLKDRLLFPKKGEKNKYYKRQQNKVKVYNRKQFNINTVTRIELEKELKIPGFIAQRIINYRSYLKGFKDLNQIEKVYDILPYQVDRIKKNCFIKNRP